GGYRVGAGSGCLFLRGGALGVDVHAVGFRVAGRLPARRHTLDSHVNAAAPPPARATPSIPDHAVAAFKGAYSLTRRWEVGGKSPLTTYSGSCPSRRRSMSARRSRRRTWRAA